MAEAPLVLYESISLFPHSLDIQICINQYSAQTPVTNEKTKHVPVYKKHWSSKCFDVLRIMILRL